MLNHIWLALICLGIGVALGSDLYDRGTDRLHVSTHLPVTVAPTGVAVKGAQPATVSVDRAAFAAGYGGVVVDTTVTAPAVIRRHDDGTANVEIALTDGSPAPWRALASAQGGDSKTLRGKLTGATGAATFTAEPPLMPRMQKVTERAIGSAKTAVELAIGLIGIMALWLGIMKVAEASGLIEKLARLVRPIMTRLFPDVPADHPAMGAMVMNISANLLGLGNAATPLGLKAMEELDKLNPKKGTATDAMCTFLVINTSNVQLIPATVIGIRAAAGAANPTDFIVAAVVATTISTVVGVTAVKLLAKLPAYRRQYDEAPFTAEA